MKYLVTGAAGFIGMHICLKLLKQNSLVVGIDNLNNYYDVNLKKSRLKILKKFKNFKFAKIDISNMSSLKKIFKKFSPTYVLHFSAQAGVRYSIVKPEVYTDSNLVGFSNVLECCRKQKIKHLVMASSSSVYGANLQYPFKETENVDHPISFYAATKKSNELMAHAYSHLYKIPITCLRLFTVYGPWGRPDMSLFLFTNAIIKNLPIKLFNKGKMLRDFTYIDDVVNSVSKITKKIPKKQKFKNKKIPNANLSLAPFKIFNIGNNKPIKLKYYLTLIEKEIGKKANIKNLPMQMGDVKNTHADIRSINSYINYNPKTDIKTGIKKFVNWYKGYYEKN